MGDCWMAPAVLEPTSGDEPGEFGVNSGALLDGSVDWPGGRAVDSAASAAHAAAGEQRPGGHVRLPDSAGYEQWLWRGKRSAAAGGCVRTKAIVRIQQNQAGE